METPGGTLLFYTCNIDPRCLNGTAGAVQMTSAVGISLTISSPGLQLSTRSSSSMASFERGSLPAGTLPGLSCSVIL